jgi:hypothetical protein
MTFDIQRTCVESLQSTFLGRLISPGSEDYERARRLHNGMIDRRPALIARCAAASDVAQAVNFARERQLTVSVRGGGHGVSGLAVCDDGLMIDLSGMKAITVDRTLRTARADAGATWAEFDRETQLAGLATTGGIERTTGIAGLTLAGGYGFLMRKYGLTCDNLRSAEIITADGRAVTANQEENPDLFWGLRGGGGNFGIVTSFEYRLHEVGPVYGGLLIYPIDCARELIQHYDDFAARAPDELGLLLVLGTLPDGMKAVILLICYCGPEDEGKHCLKPLLRFGDPIANQLGEMPYEAVQSIVEKFNPRGLRNYWRSSFLKSVPATAAEAMVDQFSKSPSPYTHVVLYTLGGAVARVPSDATAVPNRETRHSLLTVGMWEHSTDDRENIDWVREMSARTNSFSSGSFYINFESETSEDRIRVAYGSEKFARLQAIKDQYDPANFFRMNQNISPSRRATDPLQLSIDQASVR